MYVRYVPCRKKKARGKAKKASKAAKKTEVAAVNQEAEEKTTTVTNQESLEAQTQRLKIGNQKNDDAFLEEAIKLAAAEKKELKAEKKKADKLLMAQQCKHGCDPLSEGSECIGFISTFLMNI